MHWHLTREGRVQNDRDYIAVPYHTQRGGEWPKLKGTGLRAAMPPRVSKDHRTGGEGKISHGYAFFRGERGLAG